MAHAGQSRPDSGLLTDRRWFPIDLDRQTGAIRFADIGTEGRMSWREFLDIAAGEKRVAQRSLPAADAFRLVTGGAARERMNFIWHTSYCCSTAIASALDVPGRNLSIFEPQILVSVASARRESDRMRGGDITWLSDAVFRLLCLHRQDGESITVKPAPVSNYLVPDAAAKTGGKMLFLYCDCRSFLLASMRYGENRRRTVRHLFNTIRHDGGSARQWTADSIAGLTDLEIAALAWQLQIARFAEYLSRYGDRTASLDCEAFLRRPAETLRSIWRFLELPGDAEESEALRDHSFFARHAKFPDETFAPQARLAAGNGVHPDVLTEIDRTIAACANLFPHAKLPLSNPLVRLDGAGP
jgi:hypothetical protein